LGGGVIVMFGMVASSALAMLSGVTWNQRNMLVAGTALSVSLGINATPTILAEDGTQVNSAKTTSPELLLAELDRLAAEHAKKVASR